MNNWDERTVLLLGEDKVEKLKNAHVLVVGLGGVGGFAAESIARSGVGKMTIVDGDSVDTSNKNRQIAALSSTVGQQKSMVIAQRIKDINPDIALTVIDDYLEDEKIIDLIDADKYDYLVECIDTLTPKVTLLKQAKLKGLKVVSSMGAGGKVDPTQIKITDISKSYNCMLARKVRKLLKKDRIHKGIKVVFSPEEIDKDRVHEVSGMKYKRSVIGTISYMPALFGLHCASVVIRDLTID